MATALNNQSTTKVSPLDVLWAFYQSQPKKIKTAFQSRMRDEERAASKLQWEKDLNQIKALKANWDEEGATVISRVAIRNTQSLLRPLDTSVAARVRLFPTPLGAVMLTLETTKGRVKGEIGESEMSYFVKRPNAPTEYHSFETLTQENLSLFADNLQGC